MSQPVAKNVSIKLSDADYAKLEPLCRALNLPASQVGRMAISYLLANHERVIYQTREKQLLEQLQTLQSEMADKGIPTATPLATARK